MKARRALKNLRLARDGERAVAQFLEQVREKGYRVFHDIVGPDFNVDHVLVGPHGVFVIETKTISKPAAGDPRVEYDGETVRVAGYTPDRDPVRQASALAKWVGDLVKESAGKVAFVRPVVLYPGWYVEDRFSGARPAVWVLNPKAFPAFLAHEPMRLAAEDIKLISFHLSRYVRSEAQP
ncbi:MAG: NERD domain-containing protein [Chloroflexi bacterium]|nr:NERD domain-containing protein [Chloroflexota bacterium]